MSAVGVACDNRGPAPDTLAQARAAAEAGARTLWMATHLFAREPATVAALALAQTRDCRVALMAVSPYAVHPVYAAMMAATLDELAPGRVVLCLGLGVPRDLADAGLPTARPVRTLREACETARALLAGDRVPYRGEVFRLSGRPLATGARRVPVFLAASGPQTLALAGAVADGVLISAATSVQFVRWALARVDEGARGRTLERVGLVYAAADDRGAAAAARFRRTLALILRSEHHRTNLELAGSRVDQAALTRAVAEENWAAAEALVSDEVLRHHTATGTPSEVRARVGEYRSAGLDEVVLAGLSDPEETRRTLGAALIPATEETR
ncbi:MAG: LLM class flavin-dependent oxidoreductase [Candidatus Rokuibacteriota bacterium]